MGNNIKLSFGEPKYFVKDNVVICKLDAENKYFDSTYSTTAVAYPQEGDEFNVEIGKKVSMAKAELELYKQAKNDLKSYVRFMENSIVDVDDSINKLESYIQHNKKYLSSF